MKSVTEWLRQFFSNKGHHVFLAFLIAKICGFIGAFAIIHFLPQKEYGVLTLVMSLLTVFVPFTGFGSSQSLLRFGPIESDKNGLSSYYFFRGFWLELILVAIFLVLSLFYVSKYDDVLVIFLFLAVRLVSVYFCNHIQTYYRVVGKNNLFALISNVVNIGGLVLLVVLTYFFGLFGYLLAFSLAPFLAFLWLRKGIFNRKHYKPNNTKEQWRFGIFTSLTSLASDALFMVDIMIIGYMLSEVDVANYKVAMLLPYNVTFLAMSFIQADFPKLCKNYQDKEFLKNYISNYYKIFLPICIVLFVIFWLLKDYILSLFGEEYAHNGNLMLVLLFGFNFGMLVRNLFGNLLPAVGLIEINTWVAVGGILLLGLLAYVLVPTFGLMGMAVAMSSVLLLSGLVYALYFYKYLRNLNE